MFRTIAILLLAIFLHLVASPSFSPVTAQVTQAGDICDPGENPCVIDEMFLLGTQVTLDFGDHDVRIVAGGQLNLGSGDLTVFCRSFVIEAQGSIMGAGGSDDVGGTVTIETTGNVFIAGLIDLSGNPGGELSIFAGGRFDIVGGSISTLGDLGTVDITASDMNIDGNITVSGHAEESGGEVNLQVSGSITISKQIIADGLNADGGEITITAGIDIVITSTALLRARASGEGFGGGVTITAGFLSQSGNLTFEASTSSLVNVDGGSSSEAAGDGGTIDASASGDCSVLAGMLGRGGAPDALGGNITISCGGFLTISATLNASGQGLESIGGETDLSSDGPLTITAQGRIDAQGGDGGSVTLGSTVEVAVSGQIIVNTSSTEGVAGTIDIVSGDSSVTFLAAARLNADGPGIESSAGFVSVRACTVFILNGSRTVTAGAAGSITLTGVNRLEIAGTLTASTASGSIFFFYRDVAPFLQATRQVSPDPIIQRRSDLIGCGAVAATQTPTRTPTRTATLSTPGTSTPTPGVTRAVPTATPTRTHTRTFTPTITHTPAPTLTPTPTQTPTPTETSTPRPTPAGNADTNCDGVIGADESDGIVSAIFDPIFANDCPNADANMNQRNDAADFPALIGALIGADPSALSRSR